MARRQLQTRNAQSKSKGNNEVQLPPHPSREDRQAASWKRCCCEPGEACADSQGVGLVPQLGFTGLGAAADQKVGVN